MRFDQLDQVHSVVRAKCVEDFDYFVSRCFGLHTHASHEELQALWMNVRAARRAQYGFVLSETFCWLFPELVERRQSERAA
jgi:hypothetical protein